MSQIAELSNGSALEHDILFEPGMGIGAKGQASLMGTLAGAANLLAFKGEGIAMADAAHALLVTGTAGAGQTSITSNVLLINPASSGASEILTLPAEALCTGLLLILINVGGQGIIVNSDAPATVITLTAAEHGLVYCDGTTWRGFMGGIT